MHHLLIQSNYIPLQFFLTDLQIDEKMEEVKQDSNEQYTVSDVVMSHAEEDDFSGLGNLSSEVSAIYLAMQQNNSKLECVDEQSQDSISSDEKQKKGFPK